MMSSAQTTSVLSRGLRALALSSILTIGTGASAMDTLDPPTKEQERAMSFANDLSLAFEHASETIEPSVVHIITQEQTRHGFNRQVGLGSGVIVDTRGFILTNAHVVESGKSLSVRLADGREVEGEIVGTFAESDIAVVKIEATGLTPAQFGDSEALRVGQWVLAIGSPFGFQQSVTAGIVSAKGRGSIEGPMSTDWDNPPQRFQEFIQTDAAINPGNSGGPLVDLNGKVVGLNTAIASRSGGNNGLGFAIPIDIAKAIMERIVDSGRVDRGWLGIQMGRLEPERAIKLGIDGGVVLDRVIDDGPADRAGLQDGDIVVAIGGRATENLVRFSNAIMLARPGVPVEIDYIRGDRKRSTSAVVEDRDEQQALAYGGVYLEDLGITLIPRQMNITRGRRVVGSVEGFEILRIVDNSLADESGFEAGDFIYEIEGRSFDDAESVERFFDRADLEHGVRIKLRRGDASGYIDLRKD